MPPLPFCLGQYFSEPSAWWCQCLEVHCVINAFLRESGLTVNMSIHLASTTYLTYLAKLPHQSANGAPQHWSRDPFSDFIAIQTECHKSRVPGLDLAQKFGQYDRRRKVY